MAYGSVALKRSLQKNLAARRRKASPQRKELAFDVIGPDDIYLPSPYETHAPITFGTGKSLIRIHTGDAIGSEVVG